MTDLSGLSTDIPVTPDDSGPGSPTDAHVDDASSDAATNPDVDASEPNVSACRSPHTFCADFDVSTDPAFGFTGVSKGTDDSLTTSDAVAWSEPRAMLAQASVTTPSANHSAVVTKSFPGAQIMTFAFRMRVEADDLDMHSVAVATVNVYSDVDGQRTLLLILDGGRIVLHVDVYGPDGGTVLKTLMPDAAFAPGAAWHLYGLTADFTSHKATLTIDGTDRVTASVPGSVMPAGINVFAGIWYAQATKPWSLRYDDLTVDMQ